MQVETSKPRKTKYPFIVPFVMAPRTEDVRGRSYGSRMQVFPARWVDNGARPISSTTASAAVKRNKLRNGRSLGMQEGFDGGRGVEAC